MGSEDSRYRHPNLGGGSGEEAEGQTSSTLMAELAGLGDRVSVSSLEEWRVLGGMRSSE